MTGDLVKISTQGGNATMVSMDEFFDAIKNKLDAKLQNRFITDR